MTKRVIVLGGGVAGMSAAHELAERGFQVEIYELKKEYAGGKARSIDVPDTASGGRKPLPGEHGFRFFPGFYKHVTDTMKRIPFTAKNGKKNPQGVFDNLTAATLGLMARYNGKPIEVLTRFPQSVEDINDMMESVYGANIGFKPGELQLYSQQMWQLMTSCYERRQTEYEKISWWDFIKAEGRSEAYQTYLATGLTRTLVAAKAKEASAKTGGGILLQLFFSIATPGESADRLLNGPTNEVWIDPWYKYLTEKLGVKYYKDSPLLSIQCDGKKITGANIMKNGKEETVTGDYYIAALPVEKMAEKLNPDLLKADPSLIGIKNLSSNVSWMNGCQYFLNEDVKITHGHVICINTQWALTLISQPQFWENHPVSGYGDGKVKGILSVDISDWDSPGDKLTKKASDCTREEIYEEVWHQLKKSLNHAEKILLKDEMRVTWFLDPDIEFKNGATQNLEPLLVNNKDTWKWRPEALTNIPNFFLASDYIRTYTDLATMEGANEAARRSVNGILAASGSKATPCTIWPLHEPDQFKPWRLYDKIRFENGLGWNGGKVGWIFRIVNWIKNLFGKGR